MAMEWDKDPAHLKEQLSRAYGSGRASFEELAALQPTVIVFDEHELELQRARARDLKNRLDRA